jgi:hypothetical protein
MAFAKEPKSINDAWNLFGIHDPIENTNENGGGGGN